MISWRVLNATSSTSVTVEILQRHAWRYTYFSPLCNDSTIPNRQPILGSGNINCVSTCPTGLSTLGSVTVPCTSYSISEQYAAGEGRFTFNVKINSSFVATFAGKGWFVLVVSPNADWSVAVHIQTYKRLDGRYNNAPVVTMLPIYILRRLQTYVLKINVADNDFDPYRCLWSNGTTQCGNLTDNVPGATLNETSCYLTFTPQISGYYAVALTVEDFETTTSPLTSYLSQVPIQFVFRVYDSSDPCWLGPVYVGDLVADMCIYMIANATFTTRIRLQVQCPNANITNIISVNPSGFTNTAIVPDPFDNSLFIYFVSFFASPQQFGQNLYCFSGVDSVGNQGASTCLRFIVESTSVLLNPLYTQNVTRYPMGLVASTTSTWIILTEGVQYTRPETESYIRFKRLSDNADVYRLNVATEMTNVVYLSDRLVITSNVVWTPSEQYYIYFDSGILALATTCTKPSMPIIDPTFWPFSIPFETTSTTLTTTTTTSATTTLSPRTIPTQRTLAIKSTTIMTTCTTLTLTTRTTTLLTSRSMVKTSSSLTVSAIIGISIGTILLIAILGKIIITFLRVCLIHTLLVRDGLREQMYTFRATRSYSVQEIDRYPDSLGQYKLATNKRAKNYQYDCSKQDSSNTLYIAERTLVKVDV